MSATCSKCGRSGTVINNGGDRREEEMKGIAKTFMSHSSPLKKGFDPLEGIVTTLKNRYPQGVKPLFQRADSLVQILKEGVIEGARRVASTLYKCENCGHVGRVW